MKEESTDCFLVCKRREVTRTVASVIDCRRLTNSMHLIENLRSETETSKAFQHHLLFDDNSDILTLSVYQ